MKNYHFSKLMKEKVSEEYGDVNTTNLMQNMKYSVFSVESQIF